MHSEGPGFADRERTKNDDYSFPYVTRWAGGEVDLIKQTAERAVTCAAKILSGLSATAAMADPALVEKAG